MISTTKTIFKNAIVKKCIVYFKRPQFKISCNKTCNMKKSYGKLVNTRKISNPSTPSTVRVSVTQKPPKRFLLYYDDNSTNY